MRCILSLLQFIFLLLAMLDIGWMKPAANDHYNLSDSVHPSQSNSTKFKVENNLESWDEILPPNLQALEHYARGDIIPSITNLNGKISARRWKNGIIPYELGANYSTRSVKVIKRAMGMFHKYTCIKLRKRIPSDRDYIYFVNYGGCSSFVGRQRGRQTLHLHTGCSHQVSVVIHELIHALGFVHEHNRWERDNFIRINWKNINFAGRNQYKKVGKNVANDYGVPYDFGSVMHYGRFDFSKNRKLKPVIDAKDPRQNKNVGQRHGFSRGDITKINAMYRCPKKLPKHLDPNLYPDIRQIKKCKRGKIVH